MEGWYIVIAVSIVVVGLLTYAGSQAGRWEVSGRDEPFSPMEEP